MRSHRRRAGVGRWCGLLGINLGARIQIDEARRRWGFEVFFSFIDGVCYQS